MRFRDLPVFGQDNAGHSNDDPGFGTRVARDGERLINTDGTFNVRRRGSRVWTPYQSLVEMSWGQFLLLVLLCFAAINLLFGFCFWQLGPDHLSGAPEGQWWENWLTGFFFSVQTFTTVGYGAISPDSMPANLLASLVALTGLLSVALSTGLIFARFSRPRARLAFSSIALFAPYHDSGRHSLQFRVANLRDNKIINLQATVVMSWIDPDTPGSSRRFAYLKLERQKVALFPLNWTIVHVIDEQSPLRQWDHECLEHYRLEVLVLVEGYDDTYAQNVHANYSYTYKEMVWNARFELMYRSENGMTLLELNRIDDYRFLEEEE